jgi:phosphate transport system substrate-binding protein
MTYCTILTSSVCRGAIYRVFRVLRPKMKFERKAISTAAIAAIVVVVIVVVGAGAYVASSGSKTTTVTSTSVSTSTNTLVSTSVSVSTSTAASSTPSLSGSLNIAGSTLVQPLMSSWTFAYGQVQPGVQVNYASVGSGAGITDITKQTVDVGASDAPLSSAQYSALPAGSTLVTIPESISAVVPAYNIPNIKNGLNFTGNVLAQIFLGTITMWNDPQIVALNPSATLPAHAITVIHRSDGSGTMYAFTNYLTDSNAQWKSQVGYSTNPSWPTGLGCKGNEGVAGCIENTQYSIGPLEIAYAIQNPTLISWGSVENAAGNYITATGCASAGNCTASTIEAAVAAGASAGLPAGNAAWTPVSIINNIYNDTAATNAYPITTFTYLVTYQAQSSLAKGELVAGFLWWAVNHAQSAGVPLGYIPLPTNVVTLDDTTIQSLTAGGTSICTQAPSVCA